MNELLSPFLPFIWGGIGGLLIEIVDFYWKVKDENFDFSEAKDLFVKKYSITFAISGLVGAIMTYAISLTPAPIWQIVIGMSALGIVSKFIARRENNN